MWLPSVAFATTVTTDRALECASSVLHSSLRHGVSIELLGTIEAADSVSTCCYLFGTDRSFALIAGDDRMCPVLGWSDQNGLDLSDLPDPLVDWIEACRKVYASLPEGPAHPGWGLLRDATEVQSKVLSTARWGQWSSYNRCTPVFDGAHAPVGCLPLAMGIIMRYHDYPTEPACKVSTYAGLTVPEKDFDWEAIPKAVPETESESMAVSELLWHIGAHCKAKYGATATAAAVDEAFVALKNVYHMGPSMRQLQKDWLPDSVWYGLLRTEIDEGRPVLYASSQTKGIRHAYVCDGYADNGAFHFNWGWNGNGNGFYQMDAMTPCDLAALDQDHEMILGIQPPKAEVSGIQQALFSNFSADYVADACFFQAQLRLFNLGSIPWSGYLTMGRFSGSELVGLVSPAVSVQGLAVGASSKPLQFPVSLGEPLGEGESLRVLWSVDQAAWLPLLPHKLGVSCVTNQGLRYGSGYLDTTDPKILLINNLAKDYFLPVSKGELGEDRGFFQFPLAVAGYAESDRIRIGFADDEWESVGHFMLDYATDMQGSDYQRVVFDDEVHTVEIPLPAPTDDVASLYLRAWSDQPGYHIYSLCAVNGSSKNYPTFWSFNFNEPLELASTESALQGEVGVEIPFSMAFKSIDAHWQGGSFSLGGLLRGLKAGEASLWSSVDAEHWDEVALIECAEGLAFLNHPVGELYEGHEVVSFKLVTQVPLDELSGHELEVFPYAVNEYYIREAPSWVWPLSVAGEATGVESVDEELDSVRVESRDGQVLVRVGHAAVVSVVDIYGRCWVADRRVDGEVSFSLPHGWYFVRIGESVHRLLNR